MFFDRLTERCRAHNTKVTPFVTGLGMGKSNVTRWKNGMIPTGKVLIKIANELDCSIDYLLERTDNPKVDKLCGTSIAMFYERLTERCEVHNKKATPFVTGLGMGNSNATRWKNGAMPSGAVILKLANEFDCSIDYLLGRTDNPEVNK